PTLFRSRPDTRQPGKIRYPLSEVLLLCLLAVLSGVETVTNIANFGARKLAFLRRFQPFAGGTPSHGVPCQIALRNMRWPVLAVLISMSLLPMNTTSRRFQPCFSRMKSAAVALGLYGMPSVPPM